MSEWIPRRPGWLGDRKIKRIIEAEQKPTPPEVKEKLYNAVIFVRPRCPKCGSKKVKWYGTKVSMRYYKCVCGAKFKAIEKE